MSARRAHYFFAFAVLAALPPLLWKGDTPFMLAYCAAYGHVTVTLAVLEHWVCTDLQPTQQLQQDTQEHVAGRLAVTVSGPLQAAAVT